MQRQTQSSFLMIAAIAGGVTFVAFVAMMVMGGLTVSPAFFLAILVGLAAAIVLFLGFHRGEEPTPADLKPSTDGKLGDVTREAGTAGRDNIPGLPDLGRGHDNTGDAAHAGAGTGPGAAARDGSAASGGSGATAKAGEKAREGTDTGSVSASPGHGTPDRTADSGAAHERREDATSGSAQAASGTDASDRPAGPSGGAPVSPVAPGDAASDLPRGPADPGAPVGGAAHDADRDTAAGTGRDPAGMDPTAGDAAGGAAGTGEAAGDQEPRWKSSQLAGSEELSGRKGAWRYDAGDAGGDTDPAAPAAGTVGKEPERLDSAREGGADDLKKIKGVGPKLESMLHGLGFYHFDQIANWSEEEVAWVDEHLEGFNGRVSRDEWVSQAKILAAGGETEFSNRS